MEGTLFYALNDGEYKHIGEFKDLDVTTDPDPSPNSGILRYIKSDETIVLNMSTLVADLKLLCKKCGLSYYETMHPRHKQRRRIGLNRHLRNRKKRFLKEIERALLYGKEVCK